METIKVYSPIEDKEIHNNLNASPIWKQAYHEDELSEVKNKFFVMFQYSIKFDGLCPVQVTNVKKLMIWIKHII